MMGGGFKGNHKTAHRARRRNTATDFWHSSSVGTIKEGISKHGLGDFGFAQVGGQLEVEMRVALSNGRSLETTDLRRSEAKKSKAQAGGAQRHTQRRPQIYSGLPIVTQYRDPQRSSGCPRFQVVS